MLANLAGYVRQQGRLDEAAALNREAIRQYTAELGVAHPNTAITLTNLAYTEYQRRRYAEAESLYRLAVPVLDSVWRGTSQIAQTLMDFSVVLNERRKCDEAEGHLRRSLRLFLREREPTHGLVLGPQRMLGVCLAALGKLAEAESLLVDVHAKMLDGWGPDNFYTRLTARDLTTLYELMNDTQAADRYRVSNQSQ
jgi:tetratricopeptide (TPR) repeat protein